MSLDFSTLIFLFIALMTLQPLLMGRWFSMRRAQAIRAIEQDNGSRVISARPVPQPAMEFDVFR